ncbi:MAG: serine/threonine protein kinase [Planctomycetes bacterium]|nr:serine/threonine protein kinase [Planctomycetota bacterium]
MPEPGQESAPRLLEAEMVEAARRRGLLSDDDKKTLLVCLGQPEAETLVDVLVSKMAMAPEMVKDLEKEACRTLVPGYEIVEKIGAGGMGVVYKAIQKRLERVVALKMIIPDRTVDPQAIRRFEREAFAIARLNHPNIVAAYDYGEASGRLWLAMEYVEGMSAGAALCRFGAFPEARALAIAREVVLGLSHALAAGVMHRDVKPDNILLSTEGAKDASGVAGSVKLTDLGLARLGRQVIESSATITQKGHVVGSPHYMAPEQVEGEDYDFRVDIYALGATLYHLVTGVLPYAASSIMGVLRNKATRLLDHPQDVIEGISDGMVRVLDRTLARSPEHRYPNYEVFLADLDLLLAGKKPLAAGLPPGESSLATRTGAKSRHTRAADHPLPAPGSLTRITPPPAPIRRRRTALWIGCALLVTVVLAVVGVATRETSEGEPGGPAPGPGPKDELEAILASLEKVPEANRLDALGKVYGNILTRLRDLPNEERKVYSIRLDSLVETALASATALSLPPIRDAYREGRYEDLQRLVGESLDSYDLYRRKPPAELADLGAKAIAALSEDAGKRERERWALIEAESGPLATLRLLEGFEEEFPFSPVLGEVSTRRAEAERMAPWLTIQTDPSPARLILDGKDLGASPWSGHLEKGRYRLAAQADGFYETEWIHEHSLDTVFPVRLDPRPARELVEAGAEEARFYASGLPTWAPVGEWRIDLENSGIVGHVESATSRSYVSRDMEKAFHEEPFQTAPGWSFTWEMGGDATVEVEILHGPDGRSVVVGVAGEEAHLGHRDPERHLDIVARSHAGEPVQGCHPMRLEWHGDVLVAYVSAGGSWRRLGSFRPDWTPAGRIWVFAIEGAGEGRFRNFVLHPMR